MIELWQYFYHLTHRDNLEGILDHGILSNSEALRRELVIRDISDPQVQRWRDRNEPIYNRSIHDYAPLYINPKNPMLYVRRSLQADILVLKVSPQILEAHEHVFTDGNAASRDTQFSPTRDVVIQNSGEVLRAETWQNFEAGKRRRCAEILIYPLIEPCYIIGIICQNRQTADFVTQMIAIPVIVDRNHFF